MRKAKESVDAPASRSAKPTPAKERRTSRASLEPPAPKERRAREGAARSTRRAAPPEPRRKAKPAEALLPEEMLHRAMAARTPRARSLWARRGLAAGRRLDRTTQSMLLRQLYLAYFEERRFQKALEVAEQIIPIAVLPDVAHQDAARAAGALGDLEAAASHLRLAARTGPAARKAFHYWTLGSLYHLAGRYAEAISAMTRAARWGTTDKPLYQGHLAVIRCESGERVADLPALIERLAEVPAGQGYGRFVLGQMAYYGGRLDEARRYLEAFVKRSSTGRAAMAIALEAEIRAARRLLASIAKNQTPGFC